VSRVRLKLGADKRLEKKNAFGCGDGRQAGVVSDDNIQE